MNYAEHGVVIIQSGTEQAAFDPWRTTWALLRLPLLEQKHLATWREDWDAMRAALSQAHRPILSRYVISKDCMPIIDGYLQRIEDVGDFIRIEHALWLSVDHCNAAGSFLFLPPPSINVLDGIVSRAWHASDMAYDRKHRLARGLCCLLGQQLQLGPDESLQTKQLVGNFIADSLHAEYRRLEREIHDQGAGAGAGAGADYSNPLVIDLNRISLYYRLHTGRYVWNHSFA